MLDFLSRIDSNDFHFLDKFFVIERTWSDRLVSNLCAGRVMEEMDSGGYIIKGLSDPRTSCKSGLEQVSV